MTGHGIGILYLKGIVVDVLAQTQHAGTLVGDVGVVLPYGMEETVLLFARQGRGFSLQHVQQQRAFHLQVIIVGKAEGGIHETETIERTLIAQATYHGHVAVGQEGFPRRTLLSTHSPLRFSFSPLFLQPVVVVLHHDELFTAAQFFLIAQNARAYAQVKDVGTLVAPRHHDGLVLSHVVVTVLQTLYQFVAHDHLDVGKGSHTKLWEVMRLVPLEEVAYHRGVPQYARVVLLAYHLRQVTLRHGESVPGQDALVQGRTQRLAHGRQLGRVAHQHQAAVLPSIDELHEVIQQTPRAELHPGESVVGYHGGFIDDEEGLVVQHPRDEGEGGFRPGLLAVDAVVDGVGLLTGMEREDLGSPARGCQQYHTLLPSHECLHHGTHQCRLSRARIPRQQKQ